MIHKHDESVKIGSIKMAPGPGKDVNWSSRLCKKHIMKICKLSAGSDLLDLDEAEQVEPGGQRIFLDEDVCLEAGQTYVFTYKLRTSEPATKNGSAKEAGGPKDGAKWSVNDY